jgi:hypothetical protein
LPLLPLLVAGCRLASIPLLFRLAPRPDSILDCVFLLSCVGLLVRPIPRRTELPK